MLVRTAIKLALAGVALSHAASASALPCEIEQITDFPPGTPQIYVAINYDGTRIAISSTASLDPANPNPGGVQIVVYDHEQGQFTQVTNQAQPFAEVPDLDDTGYKVVWQGPGTGLYDIYFYDFSDGGIRRLTDDIEDTEYPRLSGDGKTVVVQSLADLDPGLPRYPGREIYSIDPESGEIRGITSTPNPEGGGFASSVQPRINHDGSVVAFHSRGAHDLNRDNSDGSSEYFVHRVDNSGFEQISDTAPPDNALAGDIDGRGSRVVYAITRVGPTGIDDPGTLNEIHLWDEAEGSRLLQSQQGLNSHGVPLISTDGERVLMMTSGDLDPAVPPADGAKQLFVLDLPTGLVRRASGGVELFGLGNGYAINGDGSRVAFIGFDEEATREVYLSTCPLDRNGDGLPDDIDPDAVIELVDALPDSSFAAPGHRTAILAQLAAAEDKLLAGETEEARELLQNLRKHANGCGAKADNNDWIVQCVDQLLFREAIDAILAVL